MNFSHYIKSLRSLLNKGECTKFVLGNSGADYDSVVGSLLYAFYMTTSLNVLYLPLIDCHQSDLCLRFEITTVLDALSINHHELLYTEMIPDLYSKNNTFALYDHNLRASINPANIDEIVDHHAFDPSLVKCNYLVNHCGSALTLLYYIYYPEILSNFKDTELYLKYYNYFITKKQVPKNI